MVEPDPPLLLRMVFYFSSDKKSKGWALSRKIPTCLHCSGCSVTSDKKLHKKNSKASNLPALQRKLEYCKMCLYCSDIKLKGRAMSRKIPTYPPCSGSPTWHQLNILFNQFDYRQNLNKWIASGALLLQTESQKDEHWTERSQPSGSSMTSGKK